MRHIPIRLGPLALLLAVISICMTTLGILTFTTARADLGMAEKYAATVEIRYRLESRGQAFLQEAGNALETGLAFSGLPDTYTDEEGVTWREISQEDYSLTVGIRPDAECGYRVVSWKLAKAWEEDSGKEQLWEGIFE